VVEVLNVLCRKKRKAAFRSSEKKKNWPRSQSEPSPGREERIQNSSVAENKWKQGWEKEKKSDKTSPFTCLSPGKKKKKKEKGESYFS